MWKGALRKRFPGFSAFHVGKFTYPKLSLWRALCGFDHNDSSSMAAGAAEQHDFPKEEENVLKLWEKLDAFQSCLRQSKDRPRYGVEKVYFS